MRGQIHLSPDGPAQCNALKGECPYEESGHYEDIASADSAFAERMGGLFPAQSRSTIELTSNLGTVEVADGDLSDPRARAALSSGLCGDLALAIHRQTGGAPYFLSYQFDADEEFAEAFSQNPNAVIAGSCHVLIESPTKPNHFVDSYGQQDYDSLEETYGDAVVIEGTPAMLEHFADARGAERLRAFAKSAIELDSKGFLYDNSLDELDWDGDSSEVVELELDFGAVEVQTGDLSDAQTRFYLANGLCGDLAMEVRELQNGGSVHFVVDSDSDDEDLAKAFESKSLGSHVAHAVVESKSKPGYFIDAYVLKSRSEIEGFYGMGLRKVPPEYLEGYGSRDGGKRGFHDLSSFAQSALELSEQEKSYPYGDA